MKKFRLAALVLVTLILISCGGDTPGEDTPIVPDTAGGTAEPGGDIDISGPTLEDLFPYPEHDFGGAVVHVLARQDGWADGSQDFDDIVVEYETGEVLNDAVFRRTALVEERFNVQIQVTHVNDPVGVITRNIRAGDDEYQLIQDRLVFLSANLAPQNYLIDFNTVDSINLDAPWWNQNAITDLAINNRVTTLGGDMTVSDKAGVIMTIFNKRIANDHGIENLYEVVRQGRWTLDKLYEVMVQTTLDLNGDGVLTLADDQFGLIMECFGGWMFAVASGNRLASLDSGGIPYMTLITEKIVQDYARIMRIMYNEGRVEYAANPEHQVRIFREGRSFLSVDMLSQISLQRGMEEDFGIIPLPKQDETQPNYITTISPWVSRFIGMPTTAGNPEMVGAVIDAMSRESAATIVPAFYENLLNQRVARSDESVEMLQLIFDSVVYDIGAVFNWGGVWDLQHQFISGQNENFAGFMERHEGRIEADLARTIDAMLQ